MTDTPPPPGPFQLTPARIVLLILGALLLLYLVSGLLGGLGNYQVLREAAQDARAAAATQPAQQP